MNPQLQLILGCFGLGLVIAYAWWSAVRADVLRVDLARFREDHDAIARERGIIEDYNYRVVRAVTGWLIDMAPYFSPVTLACHLHLKIATGGMPPPVASGEDVWPQFRGAIDPVVERMLGRVLKRFLRHLLGYLSTYLLMPIWLPSVVWVALTTRRTSRRSVAPLFGYLGRFRAPTALSRAVP